MVVVVARKIAFTESTRGLAPPAETLPISKDGSEESDHNRQRRFLHLSIFSHSSLSSPSRPSFTSFRFLSFPFLPFHFPLLRCLSLVETPSLTPPPLDYCPSPASSGTQLLYLCSWTRTFSTSIVSKCNLCNKYIIHFIPSPQFSGLRNALIVPPSWRFLRSIVRLQHTPNPLYLHCPPIYSQIRI